MATAIVRKAFDNYDNVSIPILAAYTPTFNKLALKTFNQISHNWEMSGPLVASYLLNFADHYSKMVILKIINIALIQA